MVLREEDDPMRKRAIRFRVASTSDLDLGIGDEDGGGVGRKPRAERAPGVGRAFVGVRSTSVSSLSSSNGSMEDRDDAREGDGEGESKLA